jgi:putative transcriptional regulator
MTSAGERMLNSAKQALAFAQGAKDHGCTVHTPEEITIRRSREKRALNQQKTGDDATDVCPDAG